MQPIRYRYTGELGLPTADDNIGLDADAHRAILPDCISRYGDTDFLAFNAHALFFLLINSVKELADRLERLEKG